MGEKGNKLSQDSVLTAELLLEKLSQIGGITSKKMFGIVDAKGQSYLKADDSNRTDFEASGSHKHSRMPYYSIPEEIYNDPETLVTWAKKAMDI